MVNLRDFVRDVIVEIVHGVKEAQVAVEGVGGRVNPANVHAVDRPSTYDGQSKSRWHVEDVHFDIAVTATEGTDARAKVGVLAGLIGSGAEGPVTESSMAVHRIKFAVP